MIISLEIIVSNIELLLNQSKSAEEELESEGYIPFYYKVKIDLYSGSIEELFDKIVQEGADMEIIGAFEGIDRGEKIYDFETNKEAIQTMVEEEKTLTRSEQVGQLELEIKSEQEIKAMLESVEENLLNSGFEIENYSSKRYISEYTFEEAIDELESRGVPTTMAIRHPRYIIKTTYSEDSFQTDIRKMTKAEPIGQEKALLDFSIKTAIRDSEQPM